MQHDTAVPIGSGGMGEVFKAWDPDLERFVALKYLRHDDPVLVERLMREARAQARVDHPSICKVYEVGEEDGRPFIAMEYVDGDPLDVAAARLSLEQKVLLVKKVVEAIQAAHAAGLVHRDLKPANILVTDRDGAPHPYVLDFGIARIEEVAGLTMTGQVMGTPGYLSPEQARGDLSSIDRRTDVFSLGVILYELLSETRPFQGDSHVEVLLNLLEVDPPPLRSIAPQIPRDLETVVMTCLAKDPERRYPSSRALADDLDRFLAGEPVQARPVGLGERLVRKARKHPFTSAAIAVAAVALIALIAGGIGGWVKYTVDLKRERDVAEANAAEAREVTNFLIEVFDFADPEQAKGREVTAREILEKGAEKIDTELGDRPEIQGRLYGIIGEVFSRLGDFDRAEPLLDKALQRITSLQDPTPELEIEARVRLADVCLYRNEIDRADDLMAPIETIIAENPALDPRYSVQALKQLGWLENEKGNLNESVRILDSAIELGTAALGVDSPLIGDILSVQCIVFEKLQRIEEALDACERAVASRRMAYGDQDPRLATSLNNYSIALKSAGDYRKAVDIGEQVLEMRIRLLGPEHPRVATALNNLGLASKKLGELDRAEGLYLRSLELRRTIYGESHPRVALVVGNLAGVYAERGELERALESYRESVAIYEATLGPEHPAITSPLGRMTKILADQGRFAEAEQVNLRVAEILEKSHGPEAPSLVSCLGRISANRVAMGRYREAENALDRARSIAVVNWGEGSEAVEQIDSKLAEVRAGAAES
ncbi:MAG: tetratricopeptide repeat protein [Thermoanaerobaculales bacterium]|jgi:serine/threonine-protein kinase|nr:tetratricopeptide repeat protein [Thermoanaerobaculales bacterium]